MLQPARTVRRAPKSCLLRAPCRTSANVECPKAQRRHRASPGNANDSASPPRPQPVTLAIVKEQRVLHHRRHSLVFQITLAVALIEIGFNATAQRESIS